MQIVFGEIASKILIVVGMLFVMLALIAAIREEFTRKAAPKPMDEGHESILKDAAEFVGQLREAPRWMSMVIVGILIIVAGSALEANMIPKLFGSDDTQIVSTPAPAPVETAAPAAAPTTAPPPADAGVAPQ